MRRKFILGLGAMVLVLTGGLIGRWAMPVKAKPDVDYDLQALARNPLIPLPGSADLGPATTAGGSFAGSLQGSPSTSTQASGDSAPAPSSSGNVLQPTGGVPNSGTAPTSSSSTWAPSTTPDTTPAPDAAPSP